MYNQEHSLIGAVDLVLWRHQLDAGDLSSLLPIVTSSDVREPISLHQVVFSCTLGLDRFQVVGGDRVFYCPPDKKCGLCVLRQGMHIQNPMGAILACHPALSTEWLDWVAKSCEIWCIRTGPMDFVYVAMECGHIWKGSINRSVQAGTWSTPWKGLGFRNDSETLYSMSWFCLERQRKWDKEENGRGGGRSSGLSGKCVWLSSVRWLSTAWFKSGKISKEHSMKAICLKKDKLCCWTECLWKSCDNVVVLPANCAQPVRRAFHKVQNDTFVRLATVVAWRSASTSRLCCVSN